MKKMHLPVFQIALDGIYELSNSYLITIAKTSFII